MALEQGPKLTMIFHALPPLPQHSTPHLAFCLNFLHLLSAPGTHPGFVLPERLCFCGSFKSPPYSDSTASLSSYIQRIFQVQTFVRFKILFHSFLKFPWFVFSIGLAKKFKWNFVCNILQVCQLQLALVKGHQPSASPGTVSCDAAGAATDFWHALKRVQGGEYMSNMPQENSGTGLQIDILGTGFMNPIFSSPHI